MAAALGLVLVAAGEFIRRTGFKVPVQGVAGAYIRHPDGSRRFILFGTVYAAHGVYGFIGPALAFTCSAPSALLRSRQASSTARRWPALA